MKPKKPRFLDFARQLKEAVRGEGPCAIDITPGKSGELELHFRRLGGQ